MRSYIKSCFKPNLDIIDFAIEIGVHLFFKDLPNDVYGFYYIYNNKNAICINKNKDNIKQWFTIAHELGHHFLHRDNERFLKAIVESPDIGVNISKIEDYRSTRSLISNMAKLYRVSQLCMTLRLGEIGVIC